VSERYLAQLEGGQGERFDSAAAPDCNGPRSTAHRAARRGHGRCRGVDSHHAVPERLPRQTLAAVRSQLVRDYGGARDERMNGSRSSGCARGQIHARAKLARALGTTLSNSTARSSARRAPASPRFFCSMGRPAIALRAALPGKSAGEERARRDRHGRQHRLGARNLRASPLGLLHGLAESAARGTYGARDRAGATPVRWPGTTRRWRICGAILDGRAVLYGQADVTVDTAGKDAGA